MEHLPDVVWPQVERPVQRLAGQFVKWPPDVVWPRVQRLVQRIVGQSVKHQYSQLQLSVGNIIL